MGVEITPAAVYGNNPTKYKNFLEQGGWEVIDFRVPVKGDTFLLCSDYPSVAVLDTPGSWAFTKTKATEAQNFRLILRKKPHDTSHS